MSTNKEIRFSAKDTGVSDMMSRLRADSRRLHEDLMRDASTSANGQKDALKYVEEQIKAIERRNRLDRESAKFTLKERYDRASSGASNEGERSKLKQKFQDGMKEINSDSQADKMQVELLKDLLETTRQNSREEIRASNREGVEDRMHRERTSQSELDEQEQQNAKQDRPGAMSQAVKGIMYARGLSNILAEGEGGGKSLLNTVTGGLMMSGNPAAMAVGGIVDTAAGMFNLAQNQLSMVYESSILRGVRPRYAMENGFGYGGQDEDRIERMSLPREEYLQRYTGSVRSYGKNVSEGHVMQDLYAEKAMGLDPAVVDEIQKLTRTMGQFREVQEVTNKVYTAMRGTGAFGKDEGSMARMNDIVNTAVTLQSDRFMRTGLQTGFDDRLKIMRGLEFMGGSYKDDRYKQATVQQLESGVSTMPNKMVHAMKLRKAKELFPNQNPFELFATIQSGDPRLIEPLMQDVMGSTDNETLQMQRMYDIFGGQLSAQNVVNMTKKMRGGNSLSVGLPGNANTLENRDFYRTTAQDGTTEINAKALILWNDTVKSATETMSLFEAGLAKLLSLF